MIQGISNRIRGAFQAAVGKRLSSLAFLSMLLVAHSATAADAARGDKSARESSKSVSKSVEASAEEFDRYFREMLQQHGIPGAAYVIVDHDQVVAMDTYGVRVKGKQETVTRHTVFRLASVSKTFAASMAAVLEHEHKFNWGDKVVRYVPELSFKTPALSMKLQVQHLLSHSSGLTPNAYDNYLEDNRPLSKILPMFATIDPNCEPGKCYGYQNVLFSLIEDVIQKATGVPYSRQLKDRFFVPLQMEDASLGWEAFMATGNRAAPHVQTGSGWRPVKVEKEYYLAAPAAGVNASISDMAQWLKAQMGYYPEVLSKDVIADLTTERVETRRHMQHRVWRDYIDHAGYGLGWRLYTVGDDRIVFHGGWVAGFRAAVAYSEKRKVGIAILMNAESRVIADLTGQFIGDITGRSKLVQASATAKK
ncbi:serine hydrolase domain-containing protein [Microbulbifer pacificus]|uniref:Serine hydrolase domain-containing protein n=1 Tax=Microbulbifer pacificus TaxID=407164 RepID=A0AAU0N2I4_9GAMM|nr:serine hydrolase domain-containing protein [Microbulbifer pacificus]WOX06329.1 serine hydrolase domain-containing protein [Microbulbifer pacificus]